MGQDESAAAPESPVVWVISAREGLWTEVAEALAESGHTTVAVHADELCETQGPRPDVVLVELAEGESSTKFLEPLEVHAVACQAPRLFLAAEVGQVDGHPADLDPLTDFLVAEPGALDPGLLRVRATRLLAMHRAELERGRQLLLAESARELAGASSWSLEPETGEFRCSWEIGSVLENRSLWGRDELPGLASRLPPEDRRQLSDAVTKVAREGGQGTLEHRVVRAPGDARYLLQRFRRIGTPTGTVVGVVLDVTEERQSVHRLQQLAHFDSLTGLVTRHQFLTKLAETLEAAGQNSPVSLLYLDLDGLKRVNDTLGHRAGDILLRQTSDRLRKAVRESEAIGAAVADGERPILGRMGGDEFTVLLPGVSPADARTVANGLVEAFRPPFEISGKRVTATVSVGLAASPTDGSKADELVRHADAAMYESKGSGGDKIEVYRPELDRSRSRRREVLERLKEAVRNRGLELHYQPRIELRTGRLVGAEALMRWNCEELGRVSPAEFIPIAEESGLIEEIGHFAIEQACSDIRLLDQAGLDDVRISVNVSGAQLMEEGYGFKLFSALQTAGTPPERIELEVTESVALFGLDRVAGLIREIRSTGMYVALDDFGTGYSSLGVLVDLQVDCMKLDQSLIRDMHMNPDAASVIRAMIVMAHSLGIGVVAEGVTEEAQEILLREVDCDEVQGFRFAPALTLSDLLTYARERNGT